MSLKSNGETKMNGAKKFLFVSLESLSGDLAWKLVQEGHSVKTYIRSEKDREVYDGFLEKVPAWEPHVDWADVTVFDDVEFGEAAQNLRKQGKKVIGGTPYTDRLEIDRDFGQSELKRHGINILPTYQFSTYDAAIDFIQTNPGRYVYKPSGNTFSGGKGLLFIGQEEDGKDLIQLLQQNKNFWAKRAPIFILQKYVGGVEVAVGAFFNGNEFIYPININFEHKRIFPGNIGPFAGEMGCYDEKTEVLTKEGWKYFKNVTKKDIIASLNPKNSQLEYHRPSAIVSFRHHKKMVRIQNQTLDILVTPDHNMWVQKRGKEKWGFQPAKEIPGSPLKMARTAKWCGKSYDIHKAQFLGIYLAEGSVSKPKKRMGGYQIAIAATHPKKKKRVQKILKQTRLSWKRGDGIFYLYSKPLYTQLLPYGKSFEKFIPQEIKNAKPEVIKAFLDSYALGDATTMRGGWRIFYTSSRRMADDIQELLLKIGRVGIVKMRNRYGKKIWIKDHWTSQKHDAFEIIERVKKIYSYWDKRDTKIVNYRGKVFCVTVPHHIIYVRRNGKPFWCGNTLMYWSEPNQLFESTLKKMEPALKESGYVGYIDINCIVNGKGIYPLEFTSRFGYPTIQIQLEGITNPAGEWLYQLASGEKFELKTKKGFQVGVRILVPTYFGHEKDKELIHMFNDLAILFKNPSSLEGIHIEDIKNDNGVWRIAGTSGVVMVVTGSGTTVEEARKLTYRRIHNIIIPNMFYRTDIGSSWSVESDRLHSWGYLR